MDFKYCSKNIFIIHRQSNVLKFMYKPFVNTIIKILENNNCNYNYLDKYDITLFNENDIVIFIGPCHEQRGIDHPNYKPLIDKNIYTILYWTEPDNTKCSTNEIWLYSKYLFHEFDKNQDQIVKFVPIICEIDLPLIDYTHSPTSINNDQNLDIKLCFMGDRVCRINPNPYWKDKKFRNSRFNPIPLNYLFNLKQFLNNICNINIV